MKDDLNQKQNEIEGLPELDDIAYENIFNVYKDNNVHFAFNIGKTISIPGDIDENFIDYIRVNGKLSWTQLSFRYYDTIALWWLICLTNGIMNPVVLPTPGTTLKIIKHKYIE